MNETVYLALVFTDVCMYFGEQVNRLPRQPPYSPANVNITKLKYSQTLHRP